MLGLKEAGTSYDACFLTNSHVGIFPQDGSELLAPDSKFSRRINRIQKKLENLSDDEFWEDGTELDALRTQVDQGQQRMQGTPPLRCITNMSSLYKQHRECFNVSPFV